MRSWQEDSLKRKELQEGWNGLSEELMMGVAEWRRQHPKATLREIGGNLVGRMKLRLEVERNKGLVVEIGEKQ